MKAGWDPVSNEHQRLADAASKLVEAIDPDFVGDLPTALEVLAAAIEAADPAIQFADLVDALDEVNRG